MTPTCGVLRYSKLADMILGLKYRSISRMEDTLGNEDEQEFQLPKSAQYIYLILDAAYPTLPSLVLLCTFQFDNARLYRYFIVLARSLGLYGSISLVLLLHMPSQYAHRCSSKVREQRQVRR